MPSYPLPTVDDLKRDIEAIRKLRAVGAPKPLSFAEEFRRKEQLAHTLMTGLDEERRQELLATLERQKEAMRLKAVR